LVVDGALLGIREDFVGVGNLLELLFRVGVVGVFVRVVLESICLYAFFNSCSVAVGATPRVS